MFVILPVEQKSNPITTGAVVIKEAGKQRECMVCGWKNETMHLLTITSKDNLTSFRVPLCEKCAEEIADELLSAIEAGLASNNMARVAGS